MAKNVPLMRDHLSHFNDHHPIEHDSQETDRVLGTRIVRRKTDENLRSGRSSSIGGCSGFPVMVELMGRRSGACQISNR
jgi:hypothetical protein